MLGFALAFVGEFPFLCGDDEPFVAEWPFAEFEYPGFRAGDWDDPLEGCCEPLEVEASGSSRIVLLSSRRRFEEEGFARSRCLWLGPTSLPGPSSTVRSLGSWSALGSPRSCSSEEGLRRRRRGLGI